jgi:hypothetical protein
MKTLFTSLIVSLLLMYSVKSSAQVVINEYSASNLSDYQDNYEKYEDWIELYNPDNSPVDLGGYYISDKDYNPTKWQIPEGVTILANSFLIFWASGRDEVSGGHFHTNFKLKQTKDVPEYVVLTDPDGTILDIHQLEITQNGHSRGRIDDGNMQWGIFNEPTAGSSNNSSTAFSGYTAKPSMSEVAGFYSGAITVEITNNQTNSVLRYTTDGSDPDQNSPVYSDPVEVSSTTIIKARAYSNDSEILPGLIEFNTYFIEVSHTLTVMSLAAEELDDLLNGNQYLRPFGTFEYFNKDGERTNIGYGEFNEHGQDSWVHPQRSIDYISRDECGYNYAIREALIPPDLTDRDEYQRIILRAAGDDNYPGIDSSALLRDFFVQNIASKADLHLDMRRGEKGVVYVNGNYWGVYGYREKVSDHDYTKYYYGQGKYDIYYFMLWGGTWAEYGGQAAWDDWNEIHDFMKYNDMSNQDNFEYVKSRYDYKSLVDYILVNSYVVCSDWINWNVAWWRGLDPEGGHQKWGYCLWDEDATFNHYINYTGVPGTTPYVEPCYPEGLNDDPGEHILVLNKLRENPEFDQYYITRYIDLYNSYFRPEYMNSYLDSIEAGMLPEMPGHIARWGGSMTQWQNNVEKIRNFISERHNYLPSGLADCYDLTGPYELTINAVPDTVGTIQINSMVHSNFPWGGYYFGGIDTKLKAESTNPNWEFDHWVINNNTITPSDTVNDIIVNLTSGDNIVAYFAEKVFNDSLVINEINYNSADDFDTDDWVEFYNPQDHEVNIAGWMFKDEVDEHIFTFPEGAVIQAKDYLVLCKDTSMFTALFPDVVDLIGNIDFGLSGGGELIRLYNADGILIDFVEYDDDDPWPTEPDGNGPTLELINPNFDNALPESWVASPDHGTPGEINSITTSIIRQKQIASLSVIVYPNPMETDGVIEIGGDYEFFDGTIAIYNMFGKEVRRYENINSKRIVFKRDDLTSGMYLVRFYEKVNNIVISKKLMIE